MLKNKQGETKIIMSIIMAMIALVIGVTILPIIADQVKAGQSGNVTGANALLLGLVTLIFIVGLIVVAIRLMIGKGK